MHTSVALEAMQIVREINDEITQYYYENGYFTVEEKREQLPARRLAEVRRTIEMLLTLRSKTEEMAGLVSQYHTREKTQARAFRMQFLTRIR